MPDITVETLATALRQVTEKLSRDKIQTVTFFANGSGFFLSRFGCVQFSNLDQAALLMTNIELLDNEPLTDAQVRLKRKHGTPKQFADAVFNAVGDISIAEARAAIDKYNKEWFEAGAGAPAQ